MGATSGSPHKWPILYGFDFFLWCYWNYWTSSPIAADLTRPDAYLFLPWSHLSSSCVVSSARDAQLSSAAPTKTWNSVVLGAIVNRAPSLKPLSMIRLFYDELAIYPLCLYQLAAMKLSHAPCKRTETRSVVTDPWHDEFILGNLKYVLAFSWSF